MAVILKLQNWFKMALQNTKCESLGPADIYIILHCVNNQRNAQFL
jgi:hypothetical protein